MESYRFSRVHFVTACARVSVGFVASVVRLDVAIRLASVGVICGGPAVRARLFLVEFVRKWAPADRAFLP